MPTDLITASGNWNWPVGVTTATVEAVAEGGWGRNTSVPAGGWGGAGGGAYSAAVLTKGAESLLVVTIGSTAAYTDARVDTVVTQNGVTRVLAKPGANANGASGGAGGSSASGTGTTKFSGGAGGNGDTFDAYGGGGGGSPLQPTGAVLGVIAPSGNGGAGGAASGAAGVGAGSGGGIQQGEGGDGGTPAAQAAAGRDYGGGAGGYTSTGSIRRGGVAAVAITYTAAAGAARLINGGII